MIKIKFNNYIQLGKNWVSVAYFKAGQWRIYNGSHYSIRNAKNADELIQEVAGEKHVAKNKIKIVKTKYLIVESIK